MNWDVHRLRVTETRDCRDHAQMQRPRELQERGQPASKMGQSPEEPGGVCGERSTGDLARASATGTNNR